MSDAVHPGPRRWPRIFLAVVFLALSCIGLTLGLSWLRASGYTHRRRAWLDQFERQIQGQLQSDLPAGNPDTVTPWLAPYRAVFDTGSARWQVHTFHDDPGEGGGWSGIGDIAVLIDDRGRKYYSRFHFCDGTVPWALGSPGSPPSPRPENLEAFLARFRPGTWTTDRSEVEAPFPRQAMSKSAP